MTKATFNEIVEDGRKRGRYYMAVRIQTEGNPGAEVIVNPSDNYEAKVAYYNKAYNDDLELIAAKASGKLIKITDVLMTNNLNDLNWFIH